MRHAHFVDHINQSCRTDQGLTKPETEKPETNKPKTDEPETNRALKQVKEEGNPGTMANSC